MQNQSAVLNTNAEYDTYLPIWTLVRDVVKGEPFVKDKTTTYLPFINPLDTSEENKARYAQYLQRASLLGATGRTESGMMGMVFDKEPTMELPSSVEYLEDNADGSGVGLGQQAQETLKDVLETGRYGLLCEFPQTDGETSMQAQAEQGMNASIVGYPAESILDWETKTVGSKTVLNFVKLQEITTQRSDDMLSVDVVTNIRVLMLDEDGYYVQYFYAGDSDGSISSDPTYELVPTMGNGNRFDYIPFYFIGSINNRPNVDPAPLQEIAELNIKHYRNSADFKESSFIVGQPTLFIGGFNETWMKDFYSNGIPFGSRAGIAGPVGSSANLIQASPNSMPQEGMKHKEEQMIALGARLITDGGQAETAEAARIKHASDVSVLSIIVGNISQAYTDAINTCVDFMEATPTGSEAVFEIDNDFFMSALTPEQAVQLMTLWQGGIVSKSVTQARLQKGGIIDSEEDLIAMNESINENPVGFMPDA